MKGELLQTGTIHPDELPVACALLDASGFVLECNALLAQLLGLDLEQTFGLTLESVIAVPQHVQRLREHLAAVWKVPGRHVCELWLRKPDGAVTPVRMHSAATGTGTSKRCRAVLVEAPAAVTEARDRPPSSRPPPPATPLPQAQPSRGDVNGREKGAPLTGATTVLVIEDESLVRKAVQHYLNAAGYRVFTASDRLGAMSCCDESEGALDLVLTDLSLGDGSTGPELVERIRARFPDVGVLYMTACPPELLGRRGFQVPPGETLEKPFSKETLLARVRKALG